MIGNRRDRASMEENTFRIENFHLRIPGLTPQEAHQVAIETAQRLAGRLPDRMTAFHLGALDLHLTIPAGTRRNRVRDLIVEAIIKRIS